MIDQNETKFGILKKGCCCPCCGLSSLALLTGLAGSIYWIFF